MCLQVAICLQEQAVSHPSSVQAPRCCLFSKAQPCCVSKFIQALQIFSFACLPEQCQDIRCLTGSACLQAAVAAALELLELLTQV